MADSSPHELLAGENDEARLASTKVGGSMGWYVHYDQSARMWSWSRVADDGELVEQASRPFGFFSDAVDDAHEHGCKGTPAFTAPRGLNPRSGVIKHRDPAKRHRSE